MNKYELSLLNDRLVTCISQMKNFLDTSDVFELSCARKNLATKVFAPKCVHHQSQVFLLSTTLIDKNVMTTFVAACLQTLRKKVVQNTLIQHNLFIELLSFLERSTDIKVIHDSNFIAISNDIDTMQVVRYEEVDDPSSQILCRSMSLLLAICGKNVTNNLDCFELNEYGISKIFNKVKITDLVRGVYDKPIDANSMY